jgi:hypothetical protein
MVVCQRPQRGGLYKWFGRFLTAGESLPPVALSVARVGCTGLYYQPPEELRRISIQKEAPYWITPSFGPLKGEIHKVTLVFRLAGTTSSLLWCAKTMGSQSTVLLEPPAPCGGMSELLAPKKVTSKDSVGRFLTTSESLPLLVSSDSLSWPILSAPQGGMPELLAPNPQVC